MSHNFKITFWGVRGTIPTSSAQHIQYGGNTSCIEVNCGGENIILDAGTGIYTLSQEKVINNAHIFLSHTHIDHIHGLPFCKFLYNDSANFSLYAGNLLPETTIEEVLDRLMSHPLFPITRKSFGANIKFNNFNAGKTINIHNNKSDISIKTLELNHPDKATGYRIEYDGKSQSSNYKQC